MQGAEYEVLDDSQEHWWKVKDEHGYVKAASYSTKEEQSKRSVILILRRIIFATFIFNMLPRF